MGMNRRRFGVLGLSLASAGLPGKSPAASAAWTRLAALDGPSPREDHGMAADAATGRLLVFGGRDAAGLPLADSWLLDPATGTFQPIDGPGPSARFGVAMVADPSAERALLFGGQAGADFFNDVSVFDFRTEHWT